MKRLPALPFLIILCLIAPILFAQKGGGGNGGGGNANQNQNQNGQASPTPSVLPMWVCNMPAGAYIVALRSIVSVSTQQYLIDGHTQVTELDIDTTGSALARFYYLEPNTPTNTPLSGTISSAQQLLQQGADATNQDVWQKVIKNYPMTTHAKTIEYRVQDKSTLTAIQTSIQAAWQNNQNTTFTPPAAAN